MGNKNTKAANVGPETQFKKKRILMTAKEVNKSMDNNKRKIEELVSKQEQELKVKKLFTLIDDIEHYIEYLISCIQHADGIYIFDKNELYTFPNYHRYIDIGGILTNKICDTDIETKLFYEKITELGYRITSGPIKSYSKKDGSGYISTTTTLCFTSR